MKWLVGASVAVLWACGDPSGPRTDLEISGIVTVDGAPLAAATITLDASNWITGHREYSTTSRADGTFTLHAAGCNGYLRAEHPRYLLESVTGFTNEVCVGRLSGVHVRMRPYPELLITTAGLPDGAVGLWYDEPLLAEGGRNPYDWSISGTLPPGLSVQYDRLQGTPTEGGTFAFTLNLASADSQDDSRDFGIEIVDGPVVVPSESCAGQPGSAVVGFQSSDIARLVRVAAGLAPTALITCADAATVTELDASGLGLTDGFGLPSVGGVQNLTALVSLDLSANIGLRDIALLQDLTALTALDLGYTGVTDVSPVGSLTSLTRLDLSYLGSYGFAGDISALDGLTALTVLDITADRVDDVTALAGMTSLDTLRAASNRIVDLGPLSGATALRYLDLARNDVESAQPLAGLTALEYLDLDGNQVGDLAPLQGLTALRTLGVGLEQRGDGGGLEPLAGLTQLRDLRLSRRRIPDTTPLHGLAELTSLTVWEAHVPTLDLAGLPNLETVLAGNDSISTVTLTDLPSLTRLDLSYNLITDLTGFEALTALEGLLLDGNRSLSNIQPLLDNPGLGQGDFVTLNETQVSCASIQALQSRGVGVGSGCAP